MSIRRKAGFWLTMSAFGLFATQLPAQSTFDSPGDRDDRLGSDVQRLNPDAESNLPTDRDDMSNRPGVDPRITGEPTAPGGVYYDSTDPNAQPLDRQGTEFDRMGTQPDSALGRQGSQYDRQGTQFDRQGTQFDRQGFQQQGGDPDLVGPTQVRPGDLIPRNAYGSNVIERQATGQRGTDRANQRLNRQGRTMDNQAGQSQSPEAQLPGTDQNRQDQSTPGTQPAPGTPGATGPGTSPAPGTTGGAGTGAGGAGGMGSGAGAGGAGGSGGAGGAGGS